MSDKFDEMAWECVMEWYRSGEHTLVLRNYVAALVRREVEQARAGEREECAKVASATVCDVHLPTGVRIYGQKAAAAIRARGEQGGS